MRKKTTSGKTIPLAKYGPIIQLSGDVLLAGGHGSMSCGWSRGAVSICHSLFFARSDISVLIVSISIVVPSTNFCPGGCKNAKTQDFKVACFSN